VQDPGGARGETPQSSLLLERRDPEFEPKMAEVLCVYREVEMRRAAGGAGEAEVAVVSYDEKPGIQAIGSTAPDLRPVPATHPTICSTPPIPQRR
jgi:hypothetical protein